MSVPPRPAFLAALSSGAAPALKKVSPLKESVDLSALLASEPQPGADKHMLEYFFQGAMDKWLEGAAAAHTFPTAVVALEPEEAAAILATWRGATAALDVSAPDYAVPIPGALAGLVSRVDALLASRFTGGAFIKLSTRSPKDSKSVFRRAVAAFTAREAAGELPPAAATNAKDAAAASAAANARIVAFSEEMVKAAIVKSGTEAVTLLLDSARVAEDLATAYEEVSPPATVSLMVRGWDRRVRPQAEYRAFVWGGKLTALGQYWHSLYFPELQDPALREVIAADVAALFDQIASGLPVPNAMLDILWLGDQEEGSGSARAMLVEVNPFMEGLGSFAGSTGLFCFYKDADVLQGRAPFQMRVREELKPVSALKAIMAADWRRLIFERL